MTDTLVAEAVESREELEVRVRKEVKAEFEGLFQVWQAKDLADLAEKQEATIKEEVAKLVKEYQEKQKPLNAEQIQKMLDQEYAEVQLKLSVNADEDTPQIRRFVIRELPQSVERKFYRQFVERVRDQAPKLAAFQQRSMDQPFEKVLVDFMDAFDGGFDILAGAVAIIINPFDKDKEITPEWVATHVASNRQLSIVMAQVEVNKLRDFFSQVFRTGQQAGTIINPNFRR